MKKTIALAAAIGLAAWTASAQPYAPPPSDHLLFTQAQAPTEGTAAKAKAAKAKKKSDAKAKTAAKSKKGDPKKASKKKNAKKKAAPAPS